jgi:hypothetical protein
MNGSALYDIIHMHLFENPTPQDVKAHSDNTNGESHIGFNLIATAGDSNESGEHGVAESRAIESVHEGVGLHYVGLGVDSHNTSH